MGLSMTTSNTPTPAPEKVRLPHADEILLHEVGDDYRFTAQVCRFFDGDQIYLREKWNDGSHKTVTIDRDKFPALVAYAIKHGFYGEHASDCAVHNEPALPRGPCDCTAALPPPEVE